MALHKTSKVGLDTSVFFFHVRMKPDKG